MPRYACQFLEPSGDIVDTIVEGDSPAEVEEEIRANGRHPLSVSLYVAESQNHRHHGGILSRQTAVARFFRYLGSLVGSGIALDRSLQIGAQSVGHRGVSDAIESIQARVREGVSLAESLSNHPKLFPPVAVGLVTAGERGGGLAEALEQIAVALERRERLRSKLRTALIYPGVMAVVGGASLIVLIFFVLPRFTALLHDAGAELPASTSLLLAGTNFLTTWWPAVLICTMLIGYLLFRWLRTEEGRTALHRFLLRIPVIAGLRRNLAGVYTGRTLAALLRRGMPVLEALDLTSEVVTDHVARKDISQARNKVHSGRSLHASLAMSEALPPAFLEIVQVGEESGRLSELLDRSADILEEDLEEGLEQLVRFVEPALILLFGAVVGFVALALLQAVYGLHSGGMPG